MKAPLFFIFIVVCCTINSVRAGHLVGGEMQYECLGMGQTSSLYRFTIKLYRDAAASGPNVAQSFDQNLRVTIYDGQGNLFYNGAAEFESENVVPDNVNNDCVTVPPGLQINEGTYLLLRALPYNPFGYHVTAERCCRSGNIDNIINAGDIGVTYSVFVSNEAQLTCNDSPVFTASPPVVVCQGEPLFLPSNATDPDGDSIAYSFCPLFDSKNTNPFIPITNQAAPPPYPSVPYNPPYSAINPLGGAPQITINAETGIISGIPTQIGEFAVGICINEYRNGVLMSTTIRDFQYKVMACVVSVRADIAEDEQIGFREYNIYNCGDTTLTIINQSTQAAFINGYEWTFQLDSVTTVIDTSTNPTITFPGFGVYQGQLVVNPSTVGGTCSDTAIINIYLYEPPDIDFSYSFDSCEIGPVSFFDETILFSTDTVVTRLWEFGDAFSIASLDSINPKRQYADAGTYTVRLTIENSSGCIEFHEETLTWAPTPIIDIAPSVFDGCLPLDVEFQNNSYPITGYTTDWDLGDSTRSAEASPIHTYIDPGIYTVSVFIESPLGCTATDTFRNLITVYDTPTANGVAVFDSCEVGPIEFFNLSTDGDTAIFRWTWDLADGSILLDTNVIYQYLNAGSYSVELKVEDYNNCIDSTIIMVDWFPAPAIQIGQLTYDGCSPYTVTIQNNSFPINGYTTEWDLGDGTFSTDASPTNTYEEVRGYDVSLTITSPTGCVGSQSFDDLVIVNPDPVAAFSFSPDVITNFESTVSFIDQSQETIAWQWAFGNGATSFEQNPIYTFPDTGLTAITLIATHPTGCQDTLTKMLDIVPNYTYWLPNAFTPNEDNINDGFRGTGINMDFKSFDMKIWNRWGETVFQTSNPFEAWNGRKNNTGKWVKNGIYVVMVKATESRGQQQEYKSFVTVVR